MPEWADLSAGVMQGNVYAARTVPRTRGGNPVQKAPLMALLARFPAHAGVILRA